MREQIREICCFIREKKKKSPVGVGSLRNDQGQMPFCSFCCDIPRHAVKRESIPQCCTKSPYSVIIRTDVTWPVGSRWAVALAWCWPSHAVERLSRCQLRWFSHRVVRPALKDSTIWYSIEANIFTRALRGGTFRKCHTTLGGGCFGVSPGWCLYRLGAPSSNHQQSTIWGAKIATKSRDLWGECWL